MRIPDSGYGKTRIEGSIGLDRIRFPSVDIVRYVTKVLPFRDNVFDKVMCNSILEHIDDIGFTLGEIHRILMREGTVSIHVLFFRRNTAYTDLQHKHPLTYDQMNYFTENSEFPFYSEFKFILLKRKIVFCRKWRLVTILPYISRWFANKFSPISMGTILVRLYSCREYRVPT